MLSGLSTIHLELSSRCNKNCWMCGRRQLEKTFPDVCHFGDMNIRILESISSQLAGYHGVVIQFHNNGESLLHPKFGTIVDLFSNQIRCMNTNGKLIVKKANEIIDRLETLTISVFEKDEEAKEQLELVKEFLSIRKDKKPYMIYRILGNVDVNLINEYSKLPGLIVYRTLYDSIGTKDFEREQVIPETGVCLDLLHHLAIDWYGNISHCVAFDPFQLGVLGNVRQDKIEDVWNGEKRLSYIKLHLQGRRKDVPLCEQCEYWGIPN